MAQSSQGKQETRSGYHIQDHMIKYAVSAHWYNRVMPVILPQLAQDLVSFMFIAQTANDIKIGLHPFVIINSLEEHQVNKISKSLIPMDFLMTEQLV